MLSKFLFTLNANIFGVLRITRLNITCQSWQFEHKSLARLVENDLILKENFISEDQERNLVDELDSFLSKHHYEKSHWDYAITEYRETERKIWKTLNRPVIERLKKFTAQTEFPEPASNVPLDKIVLPYIHVLDLAENGEIKPHVDSVRFCGGSVVVLSLLSNAILRLAVAPSNEVIALPANQPNLQIAELPPPGSYVDLHVPRRSVYVMRGGTRYLLTHAIISNTEAARLKKTTTASDFYEMHRKRRISVICRSQPRCEMISLATEPKPGGAMIEELS